MNLLEEINALIDKEYESVKVRSSTYRELQNNLAMTEKEITWKAPKLALYIKERFRATMDKEIGGLQLK